VSNGLYDFLHFNAWVNCVFAPARSFALARKNF
jgi:hypothetical protein